MQRAVRRDQKAFTAREVGAERLEELLRELSRELPDTNPCRAADSDFQHVVMINSFHVWQGVNFLGTRDEQFRVFEDVIGEFMKSPYPAWTAVGTTGLLSDGGIVEVQLIAKVR